MVFTSHPGSDDETLVPTTGPEMGLCHVPPSTRTSWSVSTTCRPGTPPSFSHAHFTEAFDEVVECSRIFGRKGDGYVALFSQHPWHWVGAGDTPRTDLRVDAVDNVWLVEMGRKRTGEHGGDWDSFDAFIRAIAASPVSCDGLSVSYVSPSRGEVRFGWHGPLMVRRQQVALRSDLRYDNPYCRCLAPRGSSPGNGQATDGLAFTVRRGDDVLDIDLQLLAPPR